MTEQLNGFLHYSPSMFDRLKSPGMLRHVAQVPAFARNVVPLFWGDTLYIH